MLSELVPDIRKTAELVAESATAVNEQNGGVQQIGASVNQLDSVAQQISFTSEGLASTAEELTSQSQKLQQVISFFQLEHAEVAPLDTPEVQLAPVASTRSEGANIAPLAKSA